MPDDTFMIQNPIAVTDDGAGAEAKAFVKFALRDSRAAGLRRLGLPPGRRRRSARQQGQVPDAGHGSKTIDEFGGWTKVNDELFDPEKGSVAKIEDDAGVSTAK